MYISYMSLYGMPGSKNAQFIVASGKCCHGMEVTVTNDTWIHTQHRVLSLYTEGHR